MEPIYETENFFVDIQTRPFVSREEGGHIRIKVKDDSITDRTKLSPKQAIEFMRLSMVVGEAFEKTMNQQGIPVVKVNYQDMGNWAFKEDKPPQLHMHIFGRARTATKQKFPEAVYLPPREEGFYEGFEPLNQEDMSILKELIDQEFQKEQFADKYWNL